MIKAFAPLLAIICATVTGWSQLAEGVRGVATRAPDIMTIDGDLSEWRNAFSTPGQYFHADLENRAVQFFYMWDEEAFYAAYRALDQKPANHAADDRLWEGDGVEWYFDTRRDGSFRAQDWGKGAVHCYWVGLKGTNVQPRFCLRPGYLDAIPKIGIEVGAKRTPEGMQVEFKLPWANFPEFRPRLNEVIGLDAELCYSDGGPRVYRTFIYGSPLSVQQPANQAKIQLVNRFEKFFWKQCAPVLAPIRCDTTWTQKTKPMVTGYMALPPNHVGDIGNVVFRLLDLNGKTIRDYPAEFETFSADGTFRRASATWSQRKGTRPRRSTNGQREHDSRLLSGPAARRLNGNFVCPAFPCVQCQMLLECGP
jgi:hypothetical protein